MKKLIILKLGNTLPDLAARRGDFEDWFITGLGLDSDHLAVFVIPTAPRKAQPPSS